MVSWSQKTSFATALVFSGFFLIWGLPAHLPQFSRQEPALAAAPAAAPEKISLSDEDVPLETQGIPIKLSGEDPWKDNQAPEVSVQDEFQKRFGLSYTDAWKPQALVHSQFDAPESIQPMINFWVHIFGVYGKDHTVFHYKDDVSVVYGALDLTDLNPENSGLSPAESDELKSQVIAEEKKRLRDMLEALSEKFARKLPLTSEDARLAKLFFNKKLSLHEVRDPDNLRLQTGFSTRFRQAITMSGRYMQEMERIFSMKGLPIELTRLPFVESAFNIRALSSASAAGLWQFIPETGRRYLKIDPIADERLDPILATYAAADHLKSEYNLLSGSWALAVNAYNTGPGRMMKAVKELGTTDIGTIINQFQDPGYQFYSRNYYPEFLAALQVYENREKYFGSVEQSPPLTYDFYMTEYPVNLRELAREVNVDDEKMQNLNPALTADILSGEKMLPPGYFVKVPTDTRRLFAMAASNLFNQTSQSQYHIVEEGETLKTIAEQYQIPLMTLERLTHYLPDEKLVIGSMIRLPENAGIALETEPTKVN